MTPAHRDPDRLASRFSAPAALAGAGDASPATLPFRGALPQAGLESTARHVLVPILEAVLVWHERARQRRALLELSEHMLRDIGISRADAFGEAAKPFWRV